MRDTVPVDNMVLIHANKFKYLGKKYNEVPNPELFQITIVTKYFETRDIQIRPDDVPDDLKALYLAMKKAALTKMILQPTASPEQLRVLQENEVRTELAVRQWVQEYGLASFQEIASFIGSFELAVCYETILQKLDPKHGKHALNEKDFDQDELIHQLLLYIQTSQEEDAKICRIAIQNLNVGIMTGLYDDVPPSENEKKAASILINNNVGGAGGAKGSEKKASGNESK